MGQVKLENNLEPYFSKKTLKQVNLGYDLGALIAVHPYEYDTITGRYRLSRGWRRVWWYVNVATTFLHSGFVIWRYLEVRADESKSPHDNVVMQFMVVFYIFPPVFQTGLLMVGTEMIELSEKSVQFFTEFTSYSRKHYWSKPGKLTEIWVCEILLDAFVYGLFFMMFLFGMFSILAPGTEAFVSSFLEDPWKLDDPWVLFVRGVSFFITEYQHYIYIAEAWVLINTLMPPTVAMLTALKHMRLAAHRSDHWEQDLAWYNRLRILAESVNRAYGGFAIPTGEIILILLSIYGVFAAIRLSGILRMAIVASSTTTFILLLSCLRSLAEYCKRSEDLLAIWNQEPKSKLHRHFLKAERPIHIRIGDANFIDVPIALTVTDIVINNSITLLLL